MCAAHYLPVKYEYVMELTVLTVISIIDLTDISFTTTENSYDMV